MEKALHHLPGRRFAEVDEAEYPLSVHDPCAQQRKKVVNTGECRSVEKCPEQGKWQLSLVHQLSPKGFTRLGSWVVELEPARVCAT